MSNIQVNHIKQALDNLYKDKIDLSDLSKLKPEDIEKCFHSRSLSAFTLHVLASATIENSAKSLVDSFDDNGLDSIYYDEQQNTLYLIQSKLISEGHGEPDTGDMHKFATGVKDLLDSNFDRFNKKINSRKEEIEEIFSDSQIKLNIVVSYTGKGFSIHNQRIIDDLLNFLNESTEWAYFTDFNLKYAHDSLNSILSGKPIEAELSLSNWGVIDEPFTAYYGQISAHDLALLWKQHRRKLFTENIRNYIGMSDINVGILKTLNEEPENFIYFNNGVTALCKSIKPLPARTVGKTTGLFECKGISIINGAQTVGSIGVGYDSSPEQINKSKVFIRLISLESCPENFGSKITIASNTQNKIEKKDFVSLDSEQSRIKTDLLLQGIIYHYKRTDDVIPYDNQNCTLDEATIALACGQTENMYAVTAKREIGKLWEDITKKPYTDLFNSDLKVHVMWRYIKLFRILTTYLNNLKKDKTGREKSIYTYGNYFILNILINKIDKIIIFNPGYDFDKFCETDLPAIIKNITDLTLKESERKYPTSLIHQLYRNYTKCRDLKSEIEKKLKI